DSLIANGQPVGAKILSWGKEPGDLFSLTFQAGRVTTGHARMNGKTVSLIREGSDPPAKDNPGGNPQPNVPGAFNPPPNPGPDPHPTPKRGGKDGRDEGAGGARQQGPEGDEGERGRPPARPPHQSPRLPRHGVRGETVPRHQASHLGRPVWGMRHRL